MTPAQLVIDIFGVRPLARIVGRDPSAVLSWLKDRPKGSGGLVPAIHHRKLILQAREHGKALTEHDLVWGRPNDEEK